MVFPKIDPQLYPQPLPNRSQTSHSLVSRPQGPFPCDKKLMAIPTKSTHSSVRKRTQNLRTATNRQRRTKTTEPRTKTKLRTTSTKTAEFALFVDREVFPECASCRVEACLMQQCQHEGALKYRCPWISVKDGRDTNYALWLSCIIWPHTWRRLPIVQIHPTPHMIQGSS